VPAHVKFSRCYKEAPAFGVRFQTAQFVIFTAIYVAIFNQKRDISEV